MKIIFPTFFFLISTNIFAQPTNYIIDSTAFSAITLDGGQVQARFADLNQDGNTDMVTIGDHGSPMIGTNQHGVCVFFGNGTGTGWTLSQNGNLGYGGIQAGDINNDGLMDVAYGMHHNYSTTDFGDQLLEAALGDGTGMNWIPWDSNLATNGETYGMFGTDLGDVNDDGWLDIGSNSFGCCAGSHIYINDTNGTWHQSFGFINGNSGHYLHFGDINHDGRLDFVTCHQNGSVYFGDGAGNFTLTQTGLPPLGNIGYNDVSLADIDNDGDDDFAFTDYHLRVYRWNNGTTQWDNASTGLPDSGTYIVARLADLDADGFADLMAMNYDSARFEIWKGNGGISWSLAWTWKPANLNTCHDLAIADVDHNGHIDILTWADYQL